MKKSLLTLTALSMSAALCACSSHNDDQGKWHGDANARTDHMAEGFFYKLDKNHDGVVTKSEYKEYTAKWFKEADTNHDGKLTEDEIKAQFQRERERMHRNHHHHKDGNPPPPPVNDDAPPPPPPPPFDDRQE